MDPGELAHLRRARDLLDREYARPLDVPATFTRLVGKPPGAYRVGDHTELATIPPCVAKAWTRPSRNGEARGAGAA